MKLTVCVCTLCREPKHEYQICVIRCHNTNASISLLALLLTIKFTLTVLRYAKNLTKNSNSQTTNEIGNILLQYNFCVDSLVMDLAQ